MGARILPEILITNVYSLSSFFLNHIVRLGQYFCVGKSDKTLRFERPAGIATVYKSSDVIIAPGTCRNVTIYCRLIPRRTIYGFFQSIDAFYAHATPAPLAISTGCELEGSDGKAQVSGSREQAERVAADPRP